MHYGKLRREANFILPSYERPEKQANDEIESSVPTGSNQPPCPTQVTTASPAEVTTASTTQVTTASSTQVITKSPTPVTTAIGQLTELTNRNEITPPSRKMKPLPPSQPPKRDSESASEPRPQKLRKLLSAISGKPAATGSKSSQVVKADDYKEAEAKARRAVLMVSTKIGGLYAQSINLGKSWSEIAAWTASIDRLLDEESAKIIGPPKQPGDETSKS